jgi:hypothetical protein
MHNRGKPACRQAGFPRSNFCLRDRHQGWQDQLCGRRQGCRGIGQRDRPGRQDINARLHGQAHAFPVGRAQPELRATQGVEDKGGFISTIKDYYRTHTGYIVCPSYPMDAIFVTRPSPVIINSIDMKKLLLVIFLAISTFGAFSQDSLSAKRVYTREDHLRMSRHRTTAGFVMLGGGIALSALIGHFDNAKGSGPGEAIGYVLSTAAIIGSIPVFISAISHKHKANHMSAGIFMESTTPGLKPVSTPVAFPAAGLTFRF